MPGTNSRTTNSKYSCSRPGMISQLISSLTGAMLPLTCRAVCASAGGFEDDHLRLLAQIALGRFQHGSRLDLADAHLRQGARDRVQLEIEPAGLVVHGHDDRRFDQAESPPPLRR